MLKVIKINRNKAKSIEFEHCAKITHTEKMLGGNIQP